MVGVVTDALKWPAGDGQVFVGWWGSVCPLCPSDISPAERGNPRLVFHRRVDGMLD